MMTRITIPSDGTYYLFVRSMGEKENSFKIAVSNKVTDAVFDNEAVVIMLHLTSSKKGAVEFQC